MIKNKFSYPCFCTANLKVLEIIIKFCKIKTLPLIIESTSAQVNQDGGYTGQNPRSFKSKINKLCIKNNFLPSKLILGGDHIGPLPWKNKKSERALKKAKELVNDCIQNDYKKIHIDTSHILRDDSRFDKDNFLSRSLELLKPLIKKKNIFLSLGTEVPPPGGSFNEKNLTRFDEFKEELNIYLNFFKKKNYKKKFAYVIEPGMNFSNKKLKVPNFSELKKFREISEKKKFFFEAHSCDYQNIKTLRNLVKNNFKFLKVGPELTYFYSKALFKMEEIEQKLFKKKSNLKIKLLKEMKKNKKYWDGYYSKNPTEKELICNKLDRMRYYLNAKSIQNAKQILEKNINSISRKNFNQYFKFSKKIDYETYLENNFDKATYFYLNKTLIKFYSASGFKII